MAADWVKCHSALRKGAKRAIARASRFVFLELCLEARALDGEVDLRADMGADDAIHDLLGGDAVEVRKAVAELTAAGMVRILDLAEGRRLLIPSWQDWNRTETSTERSKRSRAARATPATLQVLQVQQHDRVNAANVSALEERREEKIRGEEIARESAPTPPPPPRRLSERGQAVARRIADPMHADLFGALSKPEIAAAVARIDGPLQHVERADWWADIDAEVDSWVSYARSKGEGRAWSPTQALGAVEDLGRTRCRERGAKARVERERRRQEVARTGGVVEMESTTVAEDLRAANRTIAKRDDPEPPPLTAEERQRRIAQLGARIGKGAA